MKISVKGFITHKQYEEYIDCADRMAFECRPEALRAAVSDGVTCGSFLQADWAQYLVDGFVSQDDEITAIPLETCRKQWLQLATDIANKPQAHWLVKNLLSQRIPGAATLVSLVVSEKHKLWYAESLGDSCLFFVPKGLENDFTKWTTIVPEFFNNYPDYYASYAGMDNGKTRSLIGVLEPGCFYLMTDALSEWLCDQKEEALSIINGWENQDMFEDCITQLRDNNIIHDDDSTILTINIQNNEEDTFKCNDIIFTDINQMI